MCSSDLDTWLLLRDIETNGERNRGLYVLKSRGMAHSNQIREFLLTDHGADLVEVYLGPAGVVTGTVRQVLEAQERAAAVKRQQDTERMRSTLATKQHSLEAKITALRAEFENEKIAIEKDLAEDESSEKILAEDKKTLARLRKADLAPNGRKNL